MADIRTYTANINDYDNYSISILELPKNFVIKSITDINHEDFELFTKYIEWLNENTRSTYRGDNPNNYYGIQNYDYNKEIQEPLCSRYFYFTKIPNNPKIIDVKTWAHLCKDIDYYNPDYLYIKPILISYY